MGFILVTILGAFWNRARGGLFNRLVFNKKSKSIGITAIKYASLFPPHLSPLGKRIGKYGNGVVFGVVCGVLLSSWLAGIVGAIGMTVGAAFGWGKYFGGIANKTFDVNEKEVAWIDWLVMRSNNNAVLRSVAAMTLRGLMWTFFIAVPLAFFSLNALWILPVGLLLGATYYLFKFDFSIAEWVWGAVLWGATYLILQ